MAHSHEHHHEHVHELTSLNKSFIIGITLNILFVLVEFGIGFYYDSLGLLSDAGHNLGDVASLVLAMLAFRLAKVHPNSRYTYGYKRVRYWYLCSMPLFFWLPSALSSPRV